MNTENLMESLKLMGIGLVTVFAVLLFIILIGNLLIRLVNKYAPEEAKQIKSSVAGAVVDTNIAQAINMAINKLSNGKQKADKIEKI